MKEANNNSSNNNNEMNVKPSMMNGTDNEQLTIGQKLHMRAMREQTGMNPRFDDFIRLLSELRRGLEDVSNEYSIRYKGTAASMDAIDNIDNMVIDGCELLRDAIAHLAEINITAKTMYDSPC